MAKILYYGRSIRNQAAVAPAPRYVPVVEEARAWAECQTRAWVAEWLGREDALAEAELAGYEECWVAQHQSQLSQSTGPQQIVYRTEAEALAAAVAALKRWGYVEDREQAQRSAEEQAAERNRESLERGRLRRKLRPLVQEIGIAALAERLGVRRNHVGNLAKFIRGAKPDVPGEDLARIAEAAKNL